jgi:hypothetical protein
VRATHAHAHGWIISFAGTLPTVDVARVAALTYARPRRRAAWRAWRARAVVSPSFISNTRLNLDRAFDRAVFERAVFERASVFDRVLERLNVCVRDDVVVHTVFDRVFDVFPAAKQGTPSHIRHKFGTLPRDSYYSHEGRQELAREAWGLAVKTRVEAGVISRSSGAVTAGHTRPAPAAHCAQPRAHGHK